MVSAGPRLSASMLIFLSILYGGVAWAEGPSYRAPVTPPPAPAAAAPAPKFLNKDTAVNRQDYEMSTSGGEAIIMGKDVQTGGCHYVRGTEKCSASTAGL
jgi:hypothetical protein